MCRLKLCTTYFIFLCSILVWSNNVLASKSISNRSYVYVQMGMSVDALSKLYISLKSYDEKEKEWKTNNYNLTGYGDINPYISFGYYINSCGLALEAQYGVHTVFEKYINGKAITKSDSEKAYAVMNYFVINARKNLINLFSPNNIIYGKLGLGAGMVNNVTLVKGSSMNVPTPVVQGGLGLTRQLNNYMDIDLEYLYTTNLSKRTEVSNGIKQIYWLQTHKIIGSVRFKV